MIIEPTISIGDIGAVTIVLVAAVGNYFALVGRVKWTDWKVEELRRGRGLILKDWPPNVQQCFGYRNGRADQSVE